MLWLTTVILVFVPPGEAVAAVAAFVITHTPDCCAAASQHELVPWFLRKGQCNNRLPGEMCGWDNLQAAVPGN